MGVRAVVTMTNNLTRAGDEITADLVQGVNLALERLLTLAVDKSPWDQGTLAGTGAVEPATDPDEGGAVTFDTPYAARLHEHPEYNFSTDSNPNAQGKYLENAAVENKKELGDIIRKQAQR
ncbi:hypothetical protein [Microbacterium sp. BR1]|uniref:hypothetical protein n=1 Tax=Microbacterium sp. BR1 TaxID=1070896 RepID=UPI000C2B9EBF|nr:hypothetical protein [Microbacterium sp. BR1]